MSNHRPFFSAVAGVYDAVHNALPLGVQSGSQGRSLVEFTCVAVGCAGHREPAEAERAAPLHHYPITATAATLFDDDSVFAQLARAVRPDLVTELRGESRLDATTRRTYFVALQTLAMFDGRWDEAVALVDSITSLEERADARLTAGLFVRPTAAAMRGPVADVQATFAAALERELAGLPYDSVRSVLSETWVRLETAPIDLMVAFAQSRLDEDLRDGSLSWEGALDLLEVRRITRFGSPFRKVLVERVWSFLAAQPQPPGIWEAREVTLGDTVRNSPVVVANWDGTGVDVSVFPGQLWTNAGEVPGNGRDDDGNGRVDDLHGIAWSWGGEPENALHRPDLLPHEEYERMRRHSKGLGDLAVYRDTPDARAARQLLATMSGEEQRALTALQAKFMGVWHGTAVGSVLVRGNPAVRLLVVRTDFGANSKSPAPTRAWAERYGRMLSSAVAYLRSAGVRVANLSWGLGPADLEASLKANAAGGSDDERRALAAEYFGIIRTTFRTAMAESPDILFSVGAGNSGGNNIAQELMPASFDLPNVLTVGAADRHGIEASTSDQGKVDIYAFGVWVETTIPGGSRVRFSGTSLAAPQVANLAAMLLAVDPTLTTEALRRLILDTADSIRGGRGRAIRLLNPKAAFARWHEAR